MAEIFLGKNISFLFFIGIISLADCSDEKEKIQYSTRSDEPQYFNRYFQAKNSGQNFISRYKMISAGIVSHHLLSGKYIADFFLSLKKNQPIRTFVIIGPNHESRGNALIALSQRPWKTPFGYVKPDSKLNRRLREFPLAKYDEQAFIWEHSVGALIPFVAYYFPGANVVPVLLNYQLPFQQALEFGTFLSNNTGDDVLVVLSADFVHNKKREIAQAIDNKSREKLLNYSLHISLDSIKSVEMDCRNGLGLLFNFLKNRGFPKAQLLLNTHSGFILKEDIPVTSYFFMFYGKDEIYP